MFRRGQLSPGKKLICGHQQVIAENLRFVMVHEEFCFGFWPLWNGAIPVRQLVVTSTISNCFDEPLILSYHIIF